MRFRKWLSDKADEEFERITKLPVSEKDRTDIAFSYDEVQSTVYASRPPEVSLFTQSDMQSLSGDGEQWRKSGCVYRLVIQCTRRHTVVTESQRIIRYL